MRKVFRPMLVLLAFLGVAFYASKKSENYLKDVFDEWE